MSDSTARPPAPVSPTTSFARRHPILTGFGILAGLSLFAAYFPISAFVTAGLVGAHATGADRLALRGTRRAVAWIRVHVPVKRQNPAPSSPRPQPDLSRRPVRRVAEPRRQITVQRRGVAASTPAAPTHRRRPPVQAAASTAPRRERGIDL